LVRDISKIVKAEKEFWGSFPYKRYVFLLECTPNIGGGTEHLNSTVMQTSPFVFRNSDSYSGFISGLVAHEFFHTWNVKQLRPRGIDPYDFTKENYTQELWIAEGMTSYYADIISVRTGFTTVSKFIDHLGSIISSDRQRPGNKIESVADASFDAWIGGTQHWYNTESDFYERGEDVSALLDLEIRQKTSNKFSLDNVMREMYKHYPLSGTGYTLVDFQQVITEMTGWDCRQFFTDFVYGTKPLNWEDELVVAGLNVTCSDSVAKAWLGVSLYDAGGSTRINRIIAGSPAYQSGLDENDEVLALNDFRIRASSLPDRIGEMKPGDKVTLTVFQNDRLRTLPITLGIAPKTNYKVAQVGNPTELQKAIFEGWLGSKWK
ncbi:MAG TPA: PDZ domain-containing protein, partial [Bacteroidota bacterium]|nr:PDZ domain-containing protein [Bacteroidota bacterium]